ncbi:MAG: sulfite exporter TauE/SafE family protein [Fimbriimonadaceae bacterium]|nr:sulfite exporter TauE/SafE family protein [Fimbriimonadaceae bacterium]QYK56337.1 MAG: sulfite exporter TauE/SafE family protein [Fimbriimonadaceae bacterium]
MQVYGWIATLAIGLTLGLLGGGGSILTVPVLVYLFGVPATLATGDSLLVVGATALVGTVRAWRLGNVDFARVVPFAIPSVATVFAIRKWLVPLLPHQIAQVSKNSYLILIFALLMAFAAVLMMRSREPDEQATETRPALLALLGFGVGTLAGLVGAGGGFMIVPALALFAGLRMKEAVGSSLGVIAVQSLVGFTGELGRPEPVDWPFMGGVVAVALVGLFMGQALGKRIDGGKLRPAFAWFVLAMALFLLSKEILQPAPI